MLTRVTGLPTPGPAVTQGAGAVVLCVLGGAVVAFSGDWALLLGLLAGAAFVALGLLRPALFVALLLLLRPIMDNLGANRVADVPSANPAGVMGVVLIAVLVVVLSTSRRLVAPRATGAFVALLVVSALASFPAVLNVEGIGLDPLSEMIRLGALVAVYVLAGQMITEAHALRGIFVVVALSAVVPALVGLYELAQGPTPVPGFDIGRINGTFVGPLPFSAFLAVTSLILISLPRDAVSPWLRWPVLTVMFVALVATYSREGWILFLVGLALLQWRQRPQLVVGALVACAIVVAAVPTVQQRVLPGAQTASGSQAFDSLDWRFANWNGLLTAYEERPLTGWGLETTAYVNPRAPVDARSLGQSDGGYEAHNTGVRALVEGGPLLLVAYLAVFAAIILALRRIVRDRDWPQRDYARIVLSLWIAVVIISFATNDPFEATAMMYALLALTGAVEGAHARWRMDQPRHDPVPA